MKPVGIIAAGGQGSRMAAGRPKSLLQAARRPLVIHCVEQLLLAGLTDIRVYNNRSEWTDTFSELLSSYRGVSVFADPGGPSTYAVAHFAVQHLTSDRILFLYGHAPRPAEHLLRLLSLAGVVATEYVTSSRRDALSTRCGYLEPPFLVPTHSIVNSRGRTWRELFAANATHIIPCVGPGEFNFRHELATYMSYVASSQFPAAGAG